MEDNKDMRNEMEQPHETHSFHKSIDNAILFFLFLLIIQQFQRKNPVFSRDGYTKDDEYMVTMRNKHSAFPLDEDTFEPEIKKTAPLNIKNAHELYTMFNKLKPYMNQNNRKILSIYEKWQTLLNDLNDFTYLQDENTRDTSTSSGDILDFLYDIQPFIHEDYHPQIQTFSQGIQHFMEIQKSIRHLQNTFVHSNKVQDPVQKMNHLVDALQPFMGEPQKKTMEQFKHISQVMDMVKMANELNVKQNPSSSKEGAGNSQLMDLLNILDSGPQPQDHKEEESNKNIEAPIHEIREPDATEEKNESENGSEMEEIISSEEMEYEEVFQEESMDKDAEEKKGKEEFLESDAVKQEQDKKEKQE